MQKVEITIQCLCMYVPDREENVMHVLMPATHDCHGGGVEGHDASVTARREHAPATRSATGGTSGGSAAPAAPKHTTRLVWGEEELGPVIDGWALVLGKGPGTADLSLQVKGTAAGPELVSLTKFTNGRVPHAFVEDQPNAEVCARLTLRSGELTFLDSDELWDFAGSTIPIAHEGTWSMEIDDFYWVSIGAPGAPPVSLADIPVDEDGVCRFTVRCWAEPPGYKGDRPLTGAPVQPAAKEEIPGLVAVDQVPVHFSTFYTLVQDANGKPLPQFAGLTPSPMGGKAPLPPGFGVQCRSSSGELKPKGG